MTRAVLINFTLAHLAPSESDIGFALWVTGRTHQPAMTLDADRVQAFVAGYNRVRPLRQWAIAAIPLYLVGRGLQLVRRHGTVDEITLIRTRWLQRTVAGWRTASHRRYRRNRPRNETALAAVRTARCSRARRIGKDGDGFRQAVQDRTQTRER